MTLIDGKALASHLRDDLRQRVLLARFRPTLAVILVGDDPASHVYVRNKIKACHDVGLESQEHRLPATVTAQIIGQTIDALNNDPDVDGILLQLPLPAGLPSADLIERIAPDKDVDGLTTANMGRLVAGLPCLAPCTPQGSMRLIRSITPDISGLHAVVLGRSLLFGKPMGQMLIAADCTLTQTHSKSRDLPALCRQADLLVAAVGRPHMVKADWIKPGAIVIDVGINRMDDGSLVGDVDTNAAAHIAAAITPVPGGVGPMTIACLLDNTLTAALRRRAPAQS